MSAPPHISVLHDEVLEFLHPVDGGLYADGTLGAGGHTGALLAASAPTGRVVAVDRDESAIALAKERLGSAAERALFVHGSFEDLPAHLENLGLSELDGLLLDLGVSSMQLDRPERGFSFQKPGPIDMRMNPNEGPTALELIEDTGEEDLSKILRDYGEERFHRRIAKAMKRAASEGGLTTTTDLAELVRSCIPAKLAHASKIHPATRSFQGLRIAVNRELAQLETFIEAMPNMLKVGGRCAIISFHSLEDRIVKRRFRELAKTSSLPPDLARRAGERVDPICTLITRKPVIASDDEIARNPRARSAKLRVCEKAP